MGNPETWVTLITRHRMKTNKKKTHKILNRRLTWTRDESLFLIGHSPKSDELFM